MIATLSLAGALCAAKPAFNVFVFSKTAGFRHDSIPTGIEMFKALGKNMNFEIHATEDASEINTESLKPYQVVVFLSTTGDVLNNEQQLAFQTYIEDGHGFVGIHAAADTEYDWPWYGKLAGAYFLSHPSIQEAKLFVVDNRFPATSHLGKEWVRTDEWYDYRALPDANCKVVMKLDPTSYQGSKMSGSEHPISWYQTVKKGRSFYTGLGHTKESYADPRFQRHVLGGLFWAAKKSIPRQ